MLRQKHQTTYACRHLYPDGGASGDSTFGGCPATTTAVTGGSGCGTEEMGPVCRTLRGMGEV